MTGPGIKLKLAAVTAACALIGSVVVFGLGVASGPDGGLAGPAVRVSAGARRTITGESKALAQDAVRREAEEMTVRVRNIGCAGLELGSGFAIDRHTIITNRHVIAGAAGLQLDTWDGLSILGDVAQARTGRLVDIGFATVRGNLPEAATFGPAPKVGAAVTAVGYPLGGPLTLSAGVVSAYVNAETLPSPISFDGQVMQVTSRIKHGNSGGPLLDVAGRVVGVIYAGDLIGGKDEWSSSAYAIPISVLRTLLARGGAQPVVSCGR